MKNSTLLFFCFFLFFSCGQSNDQISISDQGEMLKEDPITMEFFDAIANGAKVAQETYFDMNSYQKLIEPYKEDFCNINTEIFKGNLDMEKYTNSLCQIITTSKAFYKKHPFVKEMPTKERQKLFKFLAKKPAVDMELIKENGEKRINEMSEEERQKLVDQVKESYSDLNND